MHNFAGMLFNKAKNDPYISKREKDEAEFEWDKCQRLQGKDLE